jgi:hypothetical protein
MAKKNVDLDTPFRRGERVVATRDIHGIANGTPGKVQIHNGLGQWDRYWVMFDGDRQVGQVDHHDLTRPWQLDEWMAREEAKAEAALRSEAEAQEAASKEAEGGGGGGGGGIADQIPAHLLERSKAAKQRLLG